LSRREGSQNADGNREQNPGEEKVEGGQLHLTDIYCSGSTEKSGAMGVG